MQMYTHCARMLVLCVHRVPFSTHTQVGLCMPDIPHSMWHNLVPAIWELDVKTPSNAKHLFQKHLDLKGK